MSFGKMPIANSFINKNTEYKVLSKSEVSTNFITINDISQFAKVIEEIKKI